jgi:hypothetical protein
VETVVILSLTVALAAGVVWWVTSGQIPTFFTGRRGGRPTTPPFRSEEEAGSGTSTATRGWPRAPAGPPRRRGGEARRGVVRHRASRSAFTYAAPVRDQRPPIPLTLLKIIFFVSLVSALLAGGIWAVGQFVTTLMTKLIGE